MLLLRSEGAILWESRDGILDLFLLCWIDAYNGGCGPAWQESKAAEKTGSGASRTSPLQTRSELAINVGIFSVPIT